MKKHLFALLACVFVVMVGFGITLPVLPFSIERLALTEGASRGSAAIHVGLLTGVYALGQLFFAPAWGRWSDRIGRRPLVLIGIGGYVIGQVLFGLATSLTLLYAARLLGGVLSSAILPVAAAQVADMTTEEERGRGMAWLGAATSLGFVVGPALGGVVSGRDVHFTARYGHLLIDRFSMPFFSAAILGLLALVAAMRWLPESLPDIPQRVATKGTTRNAHLRVFVPSLGPLLGLALVGQFALAIFEATFALYGQAKFHYGPADVGSVFVVCGLVMAIVQVGAVGVLATRISDTDQIAWGFGLMGTSLALLVIARSTYSVLPLVGLFALGTALIAPNLAALISKHAGRERAGSALGIQSAVNSIGQASGPLLGGALFVWHMNAPYLLTAAVLVSVAFVIEWNAFVSRAAIGSGTSRFLRTGDNWLHGRSHP